MFKYTSESLHTITFVFLFVETSSTPSSETTATNDPSSETTTTTTPSSETTATTTTTITSRVNLNPPAKCNPSTSTAYIEETPAAGNTLTANTKYSV